MEDYKIKYIKWPPGDPSAGSIPVLLQDVNGPCPLIAIANILLLRGNITLPQGVGEVAQAKVVQLVAEHLLDVNFSRSQGSSDEYRANLQHNLSDAIALLPKLTTGIDVNVRFDHPRSFEFTHETAVFDLLGIDLVHGWLYYSPEDAATAAAIGTRSYNELVGCVVTALGSAASPAHLTPSSSDRLLAAVTPAPSTQAGQQTVKPIDAAMLSSALQNSLRVSIPEGMGPAGAASASSAGTLESGWASQDSVQSEISRMMGETVKNAFSTPESTADSRGRPALPSLPSANTLKSTPGGGAAADTAAEPPAADNAGSTYSFNAAQTQPTLLSPFAAEASAESGPVEGAQSGEQAGEGAALGEDASGGGSQGPGPVRGAGAPPMTPPPSTATTAVELPVVAPGGGPHTLLQSDLVRQQELMAAVAAAAGGAEGAQSVEARAASGPVEAQQSPAASSEASPETSKPGSLGVSSAATPPQHSPPEGSSQPDMPGAESGPARERAMQEALLAREFLESNPSQLTVHGLCALQQGLQNGQLAVFFRNNHFNVVLCQGADLFILVTDQGYLYEPDVVWEQLNDVAGNTQLLTWELRPFQPHAGGVVGTGAMTDSTPAAAGPGAEWEVVGGGGGGGPDTDADFALAMQLQQEEEERARVEENQRRMQAARQAEEHRRREEAQQQMAGATIRPPRPSGPGAGGAGGSSAQGSRPGKKAKDKLGDCCVM